MRFRYEEIRALPPLAWCARVDRGSEVVPVFHGSGVEAHPRGFFEGAWDGRFEMLGFTEASIVAGTGGTLVRDAVRFSASTDPSGPIFSIAKRGSIYVSNSPAFALTAADEETDDIYPFYAYDLLGIFRQGLRSPAGWLRLRSSTVLHVHFYTIVSVDSRGGLRFESHPLSEEPRDFRDYARLVSDGVRKVVANASDPMRKRRYTPLVPLSQGYDSTAVAVLARSAGCAEAFTLVDTRLDRPDSDSGADNARALGMSCTTYDRWHYLEQDRCPEAEFGYVAVGCGVPVVAAEAQLAGRILINGEFGDCVWSLDEAEVCEAMSRPRVAYTAGISPIEFRLRVGYFAFSPACIGARHRRTLHKIAISEEMRPWAIGGDYDRPIPRRIAEEGGLPRESFGTRKRASSHSHLIFPGRFSQNALDAYRRFVDQRHGAIPQHLYRYWRTEVQRRHDLWNTAKSGAPCDPGGAAEPLAAKPILVPWNFMFTLQWTVASMRSRYAVGLPRWAERPETERRLEAA